MKRTIIAALLAVASLSAAAAVTIGPTVRSVRAYVNQFPPGEHEPLMLASVSGIYSAIHIGREKYAIPICPMNITGSGVYGMVLYAMRQVTDKETLDQSFAQFTYEYFERTFQCAPK